jgi:penicillin amidase
MSKFKLAIGISSAILIFILGFVLVAYRMMYLSIPDYNGRLDLQNLNSEVKIYRDSLAIPYIIADSEEDAAFALGFVHAQERMFQMDLMRRAGEGRLSEIFGSRTVPFDRMFRTIGLRRIIDEHYPNLSDNTKNKLSAYSRGVNSYLENYNNYSFEFDILGYIPERWQPEHSLLVAKLMAWELNISWWTDVMFSHLVQKFGEIKAAEILPGFQENAPTIIPKHLTYLPEVPLNFVLTDFGFRKFMNMQGTHIGSNNWVVNPKKSASGKVIIANDPHLAFALPGKWFISVIRGGNWRCEGFTLPGVPAIVIGKNEDIAWAVTNVMTDDADFYVEQLDSTGNRYFLDNEWKELSIAKEKILVKDSASVDIVVKHTHRGPIISDIHPYNVLFPDTAKQNKLQISMRWTAQEFSDEYNAIYNINFSSSWEEFKESLKDFTVPGQNFIYGDKAGNIGYVCAAKLPIRKTFSPTLIYDGTTSEYDWKGFVPYNEMPKIYNPSENHIASANNKTVTSFPYHISNIWEPSSRILRIKEKIEGKDSLNTSDYMKLQNDFYSHYAKVINARFLQAFEKTNISDENLQLAINLLQQWDYVMDKDQQAPTIYLTMYQKFLENIFKDEMGESLFKEYIFIANVPYRMIEEICNGKVISWIDNINTKEIESLNDIIRKSLVDALSDLETKFGSDIAAWQWNNLHSVTFRHPFDGISPLIDKIVNIGPFPISGSGTTVFNTEYSFTDPYDVKLGPSMRYIFDFADQSKFLFAMPSGQSGHVMSKHYSNTTNYWLNEQYSVLDADSYNKNESFDLFVLH